jgi:hypothetical protein
MKISQAFPLELEASHARVVAVKAPFVPGAMLKDNPAGKIVLATGSLQFQQRE